MNDKVGVMLMAFGGPDSPEAVEPFVTKLLGGKRVPPPVMAKIKERYRIIGGASPLSQITHSQAEALQEALGGDIPVEVGMSYSEPTIRAAINRLLTKGVEQIIALSLSPHYSRVSTGTYEKETRQVVSSLNIPIKLIFAKGWYDYPLYLYAIAERIEQALQSFEEDVKAEVEIIFSAHSLPLSYIEEGEPYVAQLEETVKGVAAHFPDNPYCLAYQSKGRGKEKWLGPDVETILNAFANAGKTNVLLAPVSFVADHVETLYDIDVEIKQHAEKLGINFRRALALNNSPKFIQALKDKVQEAFRALQ